jgi:hypothetical protein
LDLPCGVGCCPDRRRQRRTFITQLPLRRRRTSRGR